MSSEETSIGAEGCSANSAHSGGSAASASTGKTYMLVGSASWTAGLSRKSTTCSAPSGLAAPSSTPAYSTWRKQVSSSAAVVVSPSFTVYAGDVS